MIMIIIKTSVWGLIIIAHFHLDNYRYHAQPHQITVSYFVTELNYQYLPLWPEDSPVPDEEVATLFWPSPNHLMFFFVHFPSSMLFPWLVFIFFLFSLLKSNIPYFIVTPGFSVFLAVSVIELPAHRLLEDALVVIDDIGEETRRTSKDCLRSSTIPWVLMIPKYSTMLLKVFSK